MTPTNKKKMIAAAKEVQTLLKKVKVSASSQGYTKMSRLVTSGKISTEELAEGIAHALRQRGMSSNAVTTIEKAIVEALMDINTIDMTV